MRLRAFFLSCIIGYQHLAGATATKPTTQAPAATPKQPSYFVINRAGKRLKLPYLTNRQRLVLQQVLHRYQHKGLPLEKKSSQRDKLLLIALLLLLAGGSAYFVYYHWLAASPTPAKPATQGAPPLSQAFPTKEAVPEACGQANKTAAPCAEAAPEHIPTPQHTPAKETATPNTGSMDEALMAAFHENIDKLNDLGKDSADESAAPLNTVFNTAAKQASLLTTLLQELTQENLGSDHRNYNRYNSYSRREESHDASYDAFFAQFPKVPTHHSNQQAAPSAKPNPVIRVFVPAENKKTAANIAERIRQTA